MVVIVRSVIVIVVVIVVVVVCEESAHLVAVSAELLAGEAKRAEQLGNRRVCHGSSLRRRPGKKTHQRIITPLRIIFFPTQPSIHIPGIIIILYLEF